MEKSNLNTKESERMCKDALEQLILKDEIITDLQKRLENEQTDNSELRNKCKELESKLHTIYEQIDLNDDEEDGNCGSNINNSSQNLKNKTILFNNTKNIDKDDNFKYFGSGNNFNNLENTSEMLRLIEEKNELKSKYEALENEFNNFKERNKNLLDIEEIYKTQLESTKKKNEFLEKQANQFKEREKYIEELIERYSNLEKDYEQILSNKEIERKELMAEIQITGEDNERLKNQLNILSQNSNNFTQDLVKEIRGLDEKNKELEMNLYKAEIVYKEEIKKLQRIVNTNIGNNNGNSDSQNNQNTQTQSNQNKSMKVEELATSLTKSIRERIDSQNKKISSQNVEIVSLQYELEKTQSELKYERELNDKLQRSLAEQKFKITHTKNIDCEKEEAQVQTIMKLEDIESSKIKAKILEENLHKVTESLEKSEKVLKNLKETNQKLLKENKDKEEEIMIIMKKLDKVSKGEKLIDKEAFNTLSNLSKLNMTISALKMRETELRERIQALEGEGSGSNYNNNHNNNHNFNKENVNNNVNKEYAFGNNMQSVSFNISEDSTNNKLKMTSQGRDLLSEKFELELKQQKEDNYFLREQNFKFISDLNRLHDNLNNYKQMLDNLSQEKEELLLDKSETINRYELIIQDLKSELDRSKNLNNENIEEMRNKLSQFSEVNSKLNEQFNSLQNKFYVQSQLIQDKNAEVNNYKKRSETLQDEKEDLLKENEELQEKTNKFLVENNNVKKEILKYKKDLSDLKQSLSEVNNRASYTVNEVEERSRIVQAENSNLKEVNSKLKVKLNEMYEEGKEKENKLINLLKEENRELESRMRSEMKELRMENESIMRERSGLRLTNNELKYENGVLKEQINEINNNNNNFNNNLNRNSKTQNLNNSFNAINNTSFEKNINLNNSNPRHKLLPNPNSNSLIETASKALREENMRLKRDYEDLSNNFNILDKTSKSSKLDTQSLEIEKQRLVDLLRNKETELRNLKSEMSTLNENVKKLQQGGKLEEFLVEISTKNQTINYLIDEVEKVKKENREKLLENEHLIYELKEENENLSKSLQSLREEFDKLNLNSKDVIKDLKKENEILLVDLEDKEKEIEQMTKEKIRLENEYEDKFKNNEEYIEKIVKEIKNYKEENDALKEELENVAKGSTETFNRLSEKLNKSKKKIDDLVTVYETHIKFLKERFDHILNDFTICVNMKQQGKDFTEKFLKIVKNIESSVENVSNLAEREALNENLKSEIKNLKANLQISNEKVKKLIKENEELSEIANVKKLQMKTMKNKPNKNNNEKELMYILNLENVSKEIADLKIQENNMRVKLQTANAEIKLLNDKVNFSKETNENLNKKTNSLEEEAVRKDKEYSDINKSHKSEIIRIMDELKRIKEKWLPPERQAEFNSAIEELEKQVKSLKDDNNRKRELIVTLKGQVTELNNVINNLNSNSNSELNKSSGNTNTGNNYNNNLNTNTNLEEKVKSLNKELQRKDLLIKDLRNNLDSSKLNEKKLSEENTSLTEKLKISKIDIGRKESIIKEIKEKLKDNNKDSNTEQNLSKVNEDLKENAKKLKTEVERKDGIIKTLKAKLESVGLEVEQLRSLNLKLSKNNYNDVEKEQKQQEAIRSKLDELSSQNENLLSVVRRIFKELIATYEKLKSKSNICSNSRGYKEGLDILGVSQDELQEYINPTEKIEVYDRINNLLERSNIDAETLMNIYYSLKEKIGNMERTIYKNINDDEVIFKKYK